MTTLLLLSAAAGTEMSVLCLQRCAEMQHGEVRIVKGVDERLTGEAYVHISGSRAKLRLALAKDRTLMPVCCPSLTASPLSLYSTVMPLEAAVLATSF